MCLLKFLPYKVIYFLIYHLFIQYYNFIFQKKKKSSYLFNIKTFYMKISINFKYNYEKYTVYYFKLIINLFTSH